MHCLYNSKHLTLRITKLHNSCNIDHSAHFPTAIYGHNLSANLGKLEVSENLLTIAKLHRCVIKVLS